MSDKIVYPDEPIFIGVDPATATPDWLHQIAVDTNKARDAFYAGHAALKRDSVLKLYNWRKK